MGRPPATSVLKGVGLVVSAVLLFAVADVTTKHLAMLYAVPLVMALRYLINIGLLVAILAPRHGRSLLRTNRTGLVLLRASCLSVASLSMGLALQTMPVGETVAIIFLSPFAVMLLAVAFLGEKVTPTGWISALCGFAGVMLILRPGSGLDPAGAGLALIAAGATALYQFLSRLLAKTETTMAMLFYTALVGVLVFGAMLPWSLQGPLPSLPDALLILALGGLATLGHFMVTAAYREAPASVLAPYNYLQLVWVSLLGWQVFDHLPDGWSLLGMAIVIAAGVAVALRAKRAAA